MILVDTSVWVEHMRLGDDELADLLNQGKVLRHPFVVGEIALGGVKPQTITWIELLPAAEVAADAEVLGLVQSQGMAGRGVGYVDAHLIASCLLTPHSRLWTLDRSLQSVAADLDLMHRSQPRKRLT